MCVFDIQVQFQSGLAEVLPGDVEKTELAIEDVMGHVLLKLFDGGVVEDVTLQRAPGPQTRRSRYLVQIRVHCPCQQFVLFPRTQENMRSEMQKKTYRMLKELLTPIEVETITRVAAPWQAAECYVY